MRRAARARLRVGIPESLTRLAPNTSVQRIWSRGIASLAPRVDVRTLQPGTLRARLAACDVWFTDGHQGPLPVRAPMVIHLHEASWDDPESAHTLDPDFIERYRPQSEDAARRAERIVTVSEHSRRQIIDCYDVAPDRVHVVHNGVDLSVHRPGLEGGADLVYRAGGDGARPYILFVGTVHPRKNLPLLRAAVQRLVDDGLPHQLVLVSGPAPDRLDSDTLLAAATSPIGGRPVTNLAGISEPDLARVMADADVLCLPSLSEGFGMPVAEAMACGTPVVVSRRGALPEVVGDAGIVVEPSVDDVTAGLRQVLGNRARAHELSRLGVERAAQFSWERMADGWAQALALAGRRPTHNLQQNRTDVS